MRDFDPLPLLWLLVLAVVVIAGGLLTPRGDTTLPVSQPSQPSQPELRPQLTLPLPPVMPTPAQVVWTYEHSNGPVTGVLILTVEDSDLMYPNEDGVDFWVLPVGGELEFSRTDKRGPRVDSDVFHTKERIYVPGDMYQAEWTSVSGNSHTAVVEVTGS